MKTVTKYEVSLIPGQSGTQTIQTRDGAKSLSAQRDGAVISVFFLEETDNSMVDRPIAIAATGVEAGDAISGTFIGTLLAEDLHVFDCGEPPMAFAKKE